jgi:hypothetical protein
MRNIEEIAAEEEARLRQINKIRIEFFFIFLGTVFSGWGWTLFYQGQMGKGSLLIVLSFLFFGFGWNLYRSIHFSLLSIVSGLLAGTGGFVLYYSTRLPSFYWGKDPSFWLAIHGGAVVEPVWSPVSYLLGQAVCFLMPWKQFSLLPELSGIIFSVTMFFLMQEFISRMKNKTALNVILGWLVCGTLAVSYPFWNPATMGSGLTSGLGLLLFLLQRTLLNQENRPWNALYLLLGLLASVHPLWGILGFLNHLGSLDAEGSKLKRHWVPLILGLSPYGWIVLRENRFFPSWGGDHAFFEFFRSWHFLWVNHKEQDWALLPALASFGWVSSVLLALLIVFWLLNFLKGKSGNKAVTSAMEFWIWIFSAVGGILFFSKTTELEGPVFPWFLAGAGIFFVRLVERAAEKRFLSFFSSSKIFGIAAIGLLPALAACLLPGQSCLRGQLFFPEQHAVNLLQLLGKRSVLVCDDPFEAMACLEARLMDPIAPSAVILEQKYLNQRWYVAQCIAHEPELLFSTADIPIDSALKSLVANNCDDWAIHWALSALPGDWKAPKAIPTILTQEFEGKASASDNLTNFQYRYDLTDLPQNPSEADAQTARYFFRYITGFNELGKYLMNGGRYSDAIHAFERAIKLDSSYSEPKFYLKQMYSQKNILEAAEMEFEKTVKNHPERIDSLMKDLEEAQKDKDESKTVMLLDEMIHLNAKLADAQYQLSKIYDQQGRSQDAKSLLEASVRANPQQLEAQMRLGHTMARLGNRIKAEEAFRAVLSIDPQNKEAQVEIWKLLNK